VADDRRDPLQGTLRHADMVLKPGNITLRGLQALSKLNLG
jgi:hypothetical protein